MQDSAYLAELGGLSAHRQLIMLDLRGTGRSAAPKDIASYRCDRLVDDVEALREHLGLDRMDLLAHSAGTNLALLYTERHPAHVGRLALISRASPRWASRSRGRATRDGTARRASRGFRRRTRLGIDHLRPGDADSWQDIARSGTAAGTKRPRHITLRETRSGTAKPRASSARRALSLRTPPARRWRCSGSRCLLAGEVDLNSPPRRWPRPPGSSPVPSWSSSPARLTFRGSTTPTVSPPPSRPFWGERARPWSPTERPGRIRLASMPSPRPLPRCATRLRQRTGLSGRGRPPVRRNGRMSARNVRGVFPGGMINGPGTAAGWGGGRFRHLTHRSNEHLAAPTRFAGLRRGHLRRLEQADSDTRADRADAEIPRPQRTPRPVQVAISPRHAKSRTSTHNVRCVSHGGPSPPCRKRL